MKASPFIKECIAVAESRRFVSALIQIDFETVAKWAEARRLAFTHFRSLVENPEVRELIAGEVTATMKVRRASVYRAYADEIEQLYA